MARERISNSPLKVNASQMDHAQILSLQLSCSVSTIQLQDLTPFILINLLTQLGTKSDHMELFRCDIIGYKHDGRTDE